MHCATSLITEHLIELIERAALRLRHKPEYVRGAKHAHESKEDVRAVRRGVDEVRRGHGDGKVVEPVTGRAERDTFRAQAKGEDFGHDDPRARAPAEAEDCEELLVVSELEMR